MGKTAVITGCSSGLGLSCAVFFAKNSFKVFATLRKLEQSEKVIEQLKKEQVDEKLVNFIIMDVASDESVTEGFKTIFKQTEVIDVLICNAGMGIPGLAEYLPLESTKKQMETNFYGVIRCLKEVLPSMRKNKKGKVQVISSIGGLNGQVFNDVYCASKFAVEGMFESMHPLYKKLGIDLSIIEPGAMTSSFLNTATSNMEQSTKMDDEIMKYLGMYMKSAQKTFSDPTTCQDPMDVAKVCFQAVTEENPNLRYQPNQHQKYIIPMKLKYSDLTGDKTSELMSKMFEE
eukprot:gene7137-11450_t